MSPARAPMRPPELAGFEHLRLLGSGGYADVFLYQQLMPRREVAIKVLLTEGLSERGRQQFHDEANAMAAVSTHPFIVTVFHADVSAGGHPYLMMEYYPRQNFSVRARAEQIPVAEVLRTGIQVASAVETAHRAGILHRDIKPANILTSAYNRPGLTDFGIATSATGQVEAEGMSIPWSPPEVINGSAIGDVTADVYSLAATVYTLLAGRSPYEVVGGSNRSLDLIERIEAGQLPPTGRPDVPESLERALRHAMSRQPADRPNSALDLARMLQSIEMERGWSPTQIDLSEDPVDVRRRDEVADDDGTLLKSPTVIDSQAPVAPFSPPLADAVDRTSARGGTSTPGLISGVGSTPLGLSGRAAPRPVQSMPSADVVAGAESVESIPGSVAPEPALDAKVRQPSKRPTTQQLVLGVVAVVVALAAMWGVQKVIHSGDTTERPETQGTGGPTVPIGGGASATAKPSEVQIVDGEGFRTVSWSFPDAELADTTFTVTDVGSKQTFQLDAGVTQVTVPSAVKCVDLTAQTSGRAPSNEPVQAC